MKSTTWVDNMNMSHGDTVEVKEELDYLKCPFCGKEEGRVIRDYTGYHERETLIHCDNPDCDNLYLIVYKFSHIIKLNKEIVPKGQFLVDVYNEYALYY